MPIAEISLVFKIFWLSQRVLLPLITHTYFNTSLIGASSRVLLIIRQINLMILEHMPFLWISLTLIFGLLSHLLININYFRLRLSKLLNEYFSII